MKRKWTLNKSPSKKYANTCSITKEEVDKVCTTDDVEVEVYKKVKGNYIKQFTVTMTGVEFHDKLKHYDDYSVLRFE